MRLHADVVDCFLHYLLVRETLVSQVTTFDVDSHVVKIGCTVVAAHHERLKVDWTEETSALSSVLNALDEKLCTLVETFIVWVIFQGHAIDHFDLSSLFVFVKRFARLFIVFAFSWAPLGVSDGDAGRTWVDTFNGKHKVESPKVNRFLFFFGHGHHREERVAGTEQFERSNSHEGCEQSQYQA